MKHLDVLQKFFFLLEDSHINWVVTGSFGFWLQGINIKVNDIDIQTDKEGAYQIEKKFSEFRVKPVTFSSAEKIQSHFGILNIDGLNVEIMGDIQKRNSDGSWDSPTDLRKHKQFVEIDGMQIPVLSLAYEYEAYLKLGRQKKANMLKHWLEGERRH